MCQVTWPSCFSGDADHPELERPRDLRVCRTKRRRAPEVADCRQLTGVSLGLLMPAPVD